MLPLPNAGGRRLVVVSNRLPFTAETRAGGGGFKRSSGGLVAALEPVLSARGGVWVGWPGAAQDGTRGTESSVPESLGDVCFRPVALTAREVSLYYGGFANRTLWPLFHYFVGRTRIDAEAWEAYDRVNARFSEVAMSASGDEDLIWIHDYQLLRAPLHLRNLAPNRRIVFFLHIPFPACDVFRLLPWSRQILRGMLASDFLGFHLPEYVEHFLASAERLLGCDVDQGKGIAHWEGRTISVQAHPIGIDAAAVERLAREAKPPARDAGVQTIIGVDRLDYTKGIFERMLALERLLETQPAYQRRVVFTQLLVPSRDHVDEYRALKRQIDETVGRINGRFSDQGWTPIRYLARSLSPADLADFYRRGDIALVTPLRDGMNLVAKEYVASRIEEDGVLILSELAGSAQELQEALLVNPFDINGMADTLVRALSMPAEERRLRMSSLRDRVRANSVNVWVDRFLTAAEQGVERSRTPVASPADLLFRQLRPWLAGRAMVALFLDYDGTLTPIVEQPEAAILTDAARDVLRLAAQLPFLDLCIVSGRELEDVRERVGIAGLTYIGNHGFEIEGPGISHRPAGLERHLATMRRVAGELATIAMPGARVEHKGSTLSVHLRGVAEPARAEAERRVIGALRRRRLRVTRGKLVVEGRPPVDWGKGHAVLHVLTQRHGVDWPTRARALYAGDDTTDEDAFTSLRGIGRSIFVGTPPANGHQADHGLPDPASVIHLVRRLAAGEFGAG